MSILTNRINKNTWHPLAVIQTPFVDEINERLKKFHLVTVENAKEYINANFDQDISLFDISKHAYGTLSGTYPMVFLPAITG